jgi:hypothetical protein
VGIDTILLIIAAVCFALAAFGVPTGRVSIGWAGLFAWVLTGLV